MLQTNRKRAVPVFLAVGLAASGAAACGGEPPQAGKARAEKPAQPVEPGSRPLALIKPKSKDQLYDPKADADKQVAAATAKAGRDSKRVLVMFGGDWCGWCHKLHQLFESDKEIRTLLSEEYELVLVDTAAPHAQELLKKCKGDLPSVGYPFLAVLDADGQVVTRQKTDPLEEGDHHDPKKVKEFLARWTVPKQDAQQVLDAALARAASEDKMVFVHLGAPWCGWCHRLENFLARKEVTEPLGRDFVEVKIDIDRMNGGRELSQRLRPQESGGIPWFAFLDAKGKTLATSDGPKGNIGYPAAPEEIEHFLNMIRKNAKRIEPAQVDALKAVLQGEAAKIEAARAAAGPAPKALPLRPIKPAPASSGS
jgi:thioredoxin-related protein